jgi:hypothetical protein
VATTTSDRTARARGPVLRRRLTDRHTVRTGLLYLVGAGSAYALCLLVLAAGGDRPGDFTPWLRIGTDTYFWWEAAFIAPVIVGSGLLTAACMYLLARAGRGAGSFDDTLALLGPAVALCTAVTLVPDLVIGCLLNAGIVDQQVWMQDITHPTVTLALVWTYLLAYVVAFLIAFPVVARAVHRLPWSVAVPIGWASFAIYQGVLLVFVR